MRFWIYMLAALLPPLYLLRYIFRQDKVEKEPIGLLVGLFVAGVVSCIPAAIWEVIGEGILGIFFREGTKLYSILSAFFVVAVAEEGVKLFFLKKCSWKSPAFNYMFDAIVYAVFVSLGFAAFENILYVFNSGLGTAVARAFLSIPGHMAFSIYMGIYYGRAKLCEKYGDAAGCKKNLKTGYWTAVFLHGFYDACLFIGSGTAMVAFVGFVAVMYGVTIRTIKKASQDDVGIG